MLGLVGSYTKVKKKSKNSHSQKNCDQTSIIKTSCYIALGIIATANVEHSFKKTWIET